MPWRSSSRRRSWRTWKWRRTTARTWRTTSATSWRRTGRPMSELVWAALGVCLAFSFFNGFTDAAYSISTIIATRVLTPIKAVALAGVGNFVGLLFGKAVAETIGKGIITIAGFTPEAVALLVIAA